MMQGLHLDFLFLGIPCIGQVLRFNCMRVLSILIE